MSACMRGGMRSLGTAVGDKVPISIMQGEADPTIKEDGEYPEWLQTLHKPLATKGELEKMWQNDPESMSEEQMRRYYRLIGLAQIKEFGSEGGL